MSRRERLTNKDYAAEFTAAAENSIEAGAMSLVSATTMLRLTDKRHDNGIRNLGYAFRHALQQIVPHMEGKTFTNRQRECIHQASDALMAHIHSYNESLEGFLENICENPPIMLHEVAVA